MFGQYLKTVTINPTIGIGVITTVDIPANKPIIEMTGTIYDSKSSKSIDDNYLLQVDHDLFIGPSGGIDDQINHSCNPNCYLHIVGKRAILMSKYFIKHNTEITYDYSLSSTDNLESWSMICKCGSFNCRKIISGYSFLDDSLKEELKSQGYVPMFQTEKIFQRK